GYSTNIILRGRILCNSVVVTKGPDSGHPVGTYTPSTSNPVAGKLTQIWGNNDIDTFQLGDPSGITGGEVAGDGITTFASDGYIFLGSKTIIRGTNTPPGVDGKSPDVNPYADDKKNLDEDRFTVWYLQSMNVVSRTVPGDGSVVNGAGQVLNLDGQSDTDYYTIYTTGSHGSARN